MSAAGIAGKLVEGCLSQLGHLPVFPPKLFILWATPKEECKEDEPLRANSNAKKKEEEAAAEEQKRKQKAHEANREFFDQLLSSIRKELAAEGIELGQGPSPDDGSNETNVTDNQPFATEPKENRNTGIVSAGSNTAPIHARLLGTSVAACVFNDEVVEKGAVLVCLASKYLTVKTTIAKLHRTPPKKNEVRTESLAPYEDVARRVLTELEVLVDDPKASSSTFSEDDLADLPSLAKTLAEGLKKKGRAFDAWLAAQLSTPTATALTEYQGQASDPVQLTKTLLADLNRILRGTSIYRKKRFAGIVLNRETEDLMKTAAQGNKLERLNRFLIADAYPLQVRRRQKDYDPGKKIAVDTLTVLGFSLEEAEEHVRERDNDPDQYGRPFSSESRLRAGLKAPSGGINPLNNQWMLLHLPAHPPLDFEETCHQEPPLGYLAADITETLVALTAGRIPMFGGGSSGGVHPAPGFQFFDQACASPWFSSSDFMALQDFVKTLQKPESALAKFLWSEFDDGQNAVLGPESDSDDGQTTVSRPKFDLAGAATILATVFNKIIAGPSIFEAGRFAGVELRPFTEELKARNPKGDALIQLNRLLLEDAYGTHIRKAWFCYSDAVVAALVESNLAFAIGLSHGLRRTGTHFVVKDLEDDHRTISSFGGTHSLGDVFQNVLPQAILGLPDIGSASDHTGEHYFTAIIPKRSRTGDKLYLLRRIPEKASLQKMVADPNAMEVAAENRRKLLLESHDINIEDIRCVLGIGCVGRYRNRDSLARASSTIRPWSMSLAVETWGAGALKESTSPTFSAPDLVNLSSLVTTLKTPSREFDIWLAKELSASGTALATSQHRSSTCPPLQQCLLPTLNRIILGPSIYNDARFAGIPISPETKDLLRKSPRGTALQRLNRLLIEDAYPHIRKAREERVACFLDGEIGLDDAGNVRFNNYSYSELVLSAAIPPPIRLRMAAQSIATYALTAQVPSHQEQATAPRPAALATASTQAAITPAFDCLKNAGFRGGMISLRYPHANRDWLIGKAAFGDFWKNTVMPLTIRPITGAVTDDVLCKAKPGIPIFVHDVMDPKYNTSPTQKPNDKAEQEISKSITSFYVYSLQDPDDPQHPYGSLQIDLGNKKDPKRYPESKDVASREYTAFREAYGFAPHFLPRDYTATLNALGAIISSLLHASLQAEETRLYNLLADTFAECIQQASMESAFSSFCEAVCKEFKPYGVCCHIRFWDPRTDELVLRFGSGKYYNNAATKRRTIPRPKAETPITDLTATEIVFFRSPGSIVINDTEEPGSLHYTRNLLLSAPLVLTRLDVLSFGTFALHKHGNQDSEKSGVFCIMSSRRWFLSKPFLHAFSRILKRLGAYYSIQGTFTRQLEMQKNRALFYGYAIVEILHKMATQYAPTAEPQALTLLSQDLFKSIQAEVIPRFLEEIRFEICDLQQVATCSARKIKSTAFAFTPLRDRTPLKWFVDKHILERTISELFKNAYAGQYNADALPAQKIPVQICKVGNFASLTVKNLIPCTVIPGAERCAKDFKAAVESVLDWLHSDPRASTERGRLFTGPMARSTKPNHIPFGAFHIAYGLAVNGLQSHFRIIKANHQVYFQVTVTKEFI